MLKRKLWNFYIIIKLIGDTVISLLSFLLAYHIRFYNPIFTQIIPPIKGIPPIDIYYNFIPYFLVVCLTSYIFNGYYKNQILNFYDEIINNIKTSFFLIVLLFAVSFFYRSYEYSRVFMCLLVGINFIFLNLWHFLINSFYKKYIKYFFGKIRIGIICSADKKQKIIKLLKKDKYIKKFFLTDFKTKDDILNFLFQRKISEVIVSYDIFNSEIFQQILPEISYQGINIKILVTLPIKLSEVLIDSSLGIPVISLTPLSLTGFNFFIKRTIDIFFSIFVLAIFLIPLIFIAIIIKIDSEGPIFFIHKRVGINGKVFNCVKFRTMFKDAHKMWWSLLKKSDRGEKVLKIKNDPRVTRVGKFLRRYSIDEIPQFFNVLKGDMSIVGPRPQIIEEAALCDNYSKRRLMTLPGITGLWQITGRADVGFQEMVDLDLYYIENWSLGLDIEIMLKTLFVILSKKGAY
ncbi:MAG: sugar transferase [Endomicrobia bacterium]|nr:sugar transferase [Endomicrobiia bacterium]